MRLLYFLRNPSSGQAYNTIFHVSWDPFLFFSLGRWSFSNYPVSFQLNENNKGSNIWIYQSLKRSSRFDYNNKFLINLFLFWVDFPELVSCLCFTKRGLPFVFAPKHPPQTTRNFALVCLWCGRSGGQCRVTWLPNFLGWIVYHIFLPIVLGCASFARETSPIKLWDQLLMAN